MQHRYRVADEKVAGRIPSTFSEDDKLEIGTRPRALCVTRLAKAFRDSAAFFLFFFFFHQLGPKCVQVREDIFIKERVDPLSLSRGKGSVCPRYCVREYTLQKRLLARKKLLKLPQRNTVDNFLLLRRERQERSLYRRN